VTLQWNASSGATSYNVKRGTTSGGETFLNSTSSTSFTDNTALNGTQYYYVVTAVKSGLESGNSNEAAAKPTAPPVAPLPPTNLSASRGPGKKAITLKWTGSAGATSYTVKRALTSGGPYSVVASGITGTSFKDTGLSDKSTYFYVVTASNSGGESGPSNEDSARPQ
jgi:cellulose 1,4-beta-cellobiosidase